MWTVGKAAELAKVSVRTLHHYDEVGLLSPSGRTDAGYRLYAAQDMLHLSQILFFKSMGFSLERIQELMSDPKFDRAQALRLQRKYLREKIEEYQGKIAAIDSALEKTEQKEKDMDDIDKGSLDLDDGEIKELFGDFDPREYEDEVEKRWGNTDVYAQSAQRTKSYTKEDWERINAEAEANNARLIKLFAEGRTPDDPEVLAAIDEHRGHITKNFYDCSLEIYSGLADMYIADPRFTRNLNKVAPDFAKNLHDAMKAYVASQGRVGGSDSRP